MESEIIEFDLSNAFVTIEKLGAINDNDKSSIARGERPLYGKIKEEAHPIIEAMKPLNILSVEGNNRVYLKSSQINTYSRTSK